MFFFRTLGGGGELRMALMAVTVSGTDSGGGGTVQVGRGGQGEAAQ